MVPDPSARYVDVVTSRLSGVPHSPLMSRFSDIQGVWLCKKGGCWRYRRPERMRMHGSQGITMGLSGVGPIPAVQACMEFELSQWKAKH